jgi:hypothetical protein
MLGINFYDMQRFRVIFKPDSFRIINKGNMQILLSNYVDQETAWTIVEEIPIRALLAPLNKVKYTIWGLFGLCTLLAFVLSVSFADKTAKPLQQFCLSMEKVQKGDLDVISDIKGWHELKRLSDGFNQMVAKIKQLLVDVKRQDRFKVNEIIQMILALRASLCQVGYISQHATFFIYSLYGTVYLRAGRLDGLAWTCTNSGITVAGNQGRAPLGIAGIPVCGDSGILDEASKLKYKIKLAKPNSEYRDLRVLF